MHKKTRYYNLAFIFILLIIGILTACGQTNTKDTEASTSAESAIIEGGEIDIAVSAEPDSLDWMYTGASITRDIGWHIFESLFALDLAYEVKPMIAEDYKLSEDETTYTITIRDDVKFHNGDTVTVEDVLASLKRWENISSVGQIAHDYIDSVQKLDENTFEIQLSEPYGALLADMAAPKSALSILPKDIAEDAGDQPLDQAQIIGTGPYALDSWTSGQEIVLKKFADYSARSEDWDGLTGKKEAHIEQLNFKIVKDPQVMLNGVKTGLYDYAQNIPTDLYQTVENEPSIETISFINGYSTITPDKSEPPFDDIKVRQALNYGLDKEAIAKSVYGDQAFYELDGALFSPEQDALYSDQGLDDYLVYDPEKAKALLEASSYQGETLKMIYASDYTQYANIAEIAKEQLSQIGMNIELVAYDWATFLDKWQDPTNWDLETVGWSTRFSPNELGMLVLDSSSSGWYESDQWHDLTTDWNLATDETTRQDILSQMNQTIYEELPFIKISNVSTLDIKSNQLKADHDWVGQRFWNSWLEKQ